MVVSQQLQKHYWQVYGAETHYVPNGGLLRERRLPAKISEWGLDPGQYILFLGRFSPEKGCHLLIQAFEKLQTETQLVMAGASSYCDDYWRRLHAHASEHIKILDWISGDALDELLANAMIFVLPSDLEGLSLALLDAMGAGLCVLASDVPENEEAIEGAGFTFQRGNSEDLADRLRFLIANPAIRQAAGRAAKERVREYYQWSSVTSAIEQVYMQVMSREVPTSAAQKTRAVPEAKKIAARRKAS